MGKRGKKVSQAKDDGGTTSSSEEGAKMNTPIIDVSSDDDEDAEANEDLSLKIVEKAMRRGAGEGDAGIEKVTDLREESKKKKKNKGKEKEQEKKKEKKKKKKSKETEELNAPVSSEPDVNFKSLGGELFLEDDVKEEQMSEARNVADILDEEAETDPVEASNNMVLRRLLRGPRYFDPPDSGWGMCYNCGEEGHAAVNCTAPKRTRPCFLCGSLEHNAKQCSKVQDCFICKKGGHRAKDCPEKNRGSENSKICLKCGGAGHDMLSCRNNYCPDDLKEIQCYVCRSFGHLCCVAYTDNGPRDVSCYRCGQLGHTGLACMAFRGETSGAGLLGSCYRCGEEGHFARECSSSTKVSKRYREWSTPKKSQGNKDYDARSVPNDLGKAHKKKKIPYEGDFTSASRSRYRGVWSTEDPGDFLEYGGGFSSDIKSRRRGGWTTEHPGDFRDYEGGFPSDFTSKHRGGWNAEGRGDFHSSKHRANGWRSPATPCNKKAKNSNCYASGRASISHRFAYSNSTSYGSRLHDQHKFSTSRFWNNSSVVPQRNYDWY